MDDIQLHVVSNTGPLISAFQSDSFQLLVELFGQVHTTTECLRELREHGWSQMVEQAGTNLVPHDLTNEEQSRAIELAERIAAHPRTADREPRHHLGEAEAMVLAQRHEFEGMILLLDELAAREVGARAGLEIAGFAGALVIAAKKGLVSADQVRARLEKCRQLGTHYSSALIEQMTEAAKGK